MPVQRGEKKILKPSAAGMGASRQRPWTWVIRPSGPLRIQSRERSASLV
ncbi:MAG: hypothetical protein IRY84_15560 [Thermobispora bispora]|nr:hypothetical protein [Thermobispora bispora]